MCVCMYIPMYVCMYACMYVCIYLCICHSINDHFTHFCDLGFSVQ